MVNDSLRFAAVLTRYRLEAGLTQQELAERANLSTRGVSDLERGLKMRPRMYTVLQLADALQLSAEQRAIFQRAARPRDATVDGTRQVAVPLPLPTPLTPMIGREREEAEAVHLLRWQGIKLLTLLGPGGIGKTRLALEVARRLRADFDESLALVALSSIREPELLLPTIIEAVGLEGGGAQSPQTVLIQHFRDRQVLLVLDNFELVIESASLIAEMLAACPRVQVLATSRMPLHLRAEHTMAIEPLAMSANSSEQNAETAARSPAVALLVASAQLFRPDFCPLPGDRPALAAICRRLEGVPLALELAAAHLKTLSPDSLLARLERRLPMLADGPRDLPARQRTMRDTIAWSYDLLGREDQGLFRSLAVFAGGCTVDAVTAVSAPGQSPDSVLAALATLGDKSLLQIREGDDGTLRFNLLDTVQEYALEQLAAAEEEIAVQRRHLGHFLSLAEEAEPQLRGTDQAAWLRRLDNDRDNLRAALRVARGTGDLERGLRLASALWHFWYTRGHLQEGRRWFEGLLALEAIVGTPASQSLRASTGVRAGILAAEAGDHPRASALASEALALYRETDHKAGMATALNLLGTVAKYQGDLRRAAGYFQEALTLNREVGSTDNVARLLNNLGAIAVDLGEHDRAVALLEESVAIKRDLADERGIAIALNNLAEVFRDSGNLERAEPLYAESMRMFQHMGEKWGLTLALANLCDVARRRGDLVKARPLGEESVRVAREVGNAWNIAFSLKSLADVLRDGSKFEQAATLYRESLAIYRDTDNHTDVIDCLEAVASLEQQEGRLHRAAALWRATCALREGAHVPLRSINRARRDASIEALPAELQPQAQWRGPDDGAASTMSLDQALDFCIDESLLPVFA